MINREDMLELTRRMTPARNCFSRVAGAYMDAEGYEDGSFNTFFRNLGAADTKKNLALAKAIPFSATNEQLMEYSFPEGEARRNSFWPVLSELNRKRLQDDGLLSVVYEVMGENYRTDREYGIFIFSGSYDVPVKASDNEWLEGSEEVYDFLTQFRHAPVGGVGGVALLQAIDAGLADGPGGHEVRLAHAQGNHILHLGGNVEELADARGGNGVHARGEAFLPVALLLNHGDTTNLRSRSSSLMMTPSFL